MFYFTAYCPYPNIPEINGIKVKLMVQFYVRFGELFKKNKGILEFYPYCFFLNLAIYQCFETNQVHAPGKKKKKKKKKKNLHGTRVHAAQVLYLQLHSENPIVAF